MLALQIAFLAMMVGPKVAAAAAQGALASLADQEAPAAGSEGVNGAPSSAPPGDPALQPAAMGLPAAPDLKGPISAAAMKAAAAAALGAAAARARLLAQVRRSWSAGGVLVMGCHWSMPGSTLQPTCSCQGLQLLSWRWAVCVGVAVCGVLWGVDEGACTVVLYCSCPHTALVADTGMTIDHTPAF